jgi:hypothetical protein
VAVSPQRQATTRNPANDVTRTLVIDDVEGPGV